MTYPKNPNPPPQHERPRITEGICYHLGDSRYEILGSDGDLEARCADQYHCDLFVKKGCALMRWIGYIEAVCEDCGETGANCKCD
jgi:hypothetical protein